MGKGNLKFGGKSGYLPKPRPIFKTSIFPTKREKSPNTGYADGIEQPRGSTRDQPAPKYTPLFKRIQLTVLEPTNKIPIDKISTLPILQQIKIQNSELRRKYLKESYIKEANRLEIAKTKEEEQKIEAERIKEERLRDEVESELFKLTIPSIEQYLKGPIMRQRTLEEQLIVQLKRKANRMNNELLVKTKMASNLLDLYNSASSLITTEEQLNQAIIDAFDKPTDQLYMDNFTSLEESMVKKLESSIRSTLLGNTGSKSGPGLHEVIDVLNGENDKLMEIALQKMAKFNEENKLNSIDIVTKGERDMLNKL